MIIKKSIFFRYFIPLLILILFFAYNQLKSNAFVILAIVLLGVMILFADGTELLFSCALFIPNIDMMRFLSSQSSIVSYYVLFICIKLIIIERIKIKPIYLIHLLFVFITCCLYLNFSLVLSAFRTVVLLITLSHILKKEANNKLLMQKIILLFVFGVFINCFFGLFYYLINKMNIYDIFFPFSGVRNDRNYFASLISVALALSVILISNVKKSFIYLIPMGLLMFFCGLLTSSRTFIISVLLIPIMILVLLFSKKNIIVSLVVITLFIFGILIFNNVFSTALTRVISRFNSSDVSTGNNRVVLWEFYLQLTFSNPLRLFFGNGPAIQYVNYINSYGDIVSHVEHNTFVQLFSNIGFLGTFSLILCYLETYKPLFAIKEKHRLYSFFPMAAGFVFYITINSLYALQFDFAVFTSIFAIKLCSFHKKNFFKKFNKYIFT